jgi:hypothetical protein
MDSPFGLDPVPNWVSLRNNARCLCTTLWGHREGQALTKLWVMTPSLQALHRRRHDGFLYGLSKARPVFDLLGQGALLRLGYSTSTRGQRSAQTNGNTGHEANVALCYTRSNKWLRTPRRA